MDWFYKLSGISPGELLDFSIPKDKPISHIKSESLQRSMLIDMENIDDIVYRYIFRHKSPYGLVKELHIIEVVLTEPSYVKAIAESLHKTIPYSKVVIFSSQGKYLLFYADSDEKEIFHRHFTDWVYEEELLAHSCLGFENPPKFFPDVCNLDTIERLPVQLISLFSDVSSNEYICLRHLIDILKIRESKLERELVLPILSALISEDRIVHLEEMPFVLQRDADQQCRWLFDTVKFQSIVDMRFGIDRQFALLRSDEFTSVSEVFQLLHAAENYFCE